MTEQSQPIQVVPANRIHVIIRGRKQIIFDGDAKSVTSHNDTGVFDVLPQHANFISLINQSIVLHTMDGQQKKVAIDNGVIKVKDNTAHCYINLLSAEKSTTTEDAAVKTKQ